MCWSIRPGTTFAPAASISSTPGIFTSSVTSIAMILPPAMRMSRRPRCSGAQTSALRIRIAAGSFFMVIVSFDCSSGWLTFGRDGSACRHAVRVMSGGSLERFHRALFLRATWDLPQSRARSTRSVDQPNRKFSHNFYGPYVFFARTPTSGVKRTMLTTQRNVR